MSDQGEHQLLRLNIGDDSDGWAEAGFTVVDDEVRVGSTTIRLQGTGGRRGILDAAIDGMTESVEDLSMSPPIPSFTPTITPIHLNLVSALDHVVATSPDMDRTVAALTDAGLTLSRTRLHETAESTNRQAFFWLGDVILELAGPDGTHDPDPATWWGLAFTCADLDDAHDALHGRLGESEDAVQPGRRIAGLRCRELDISVPIVFMSPHTPVGERKP